MATAAPCSRPELESLLFGQPLFARGANGDATVEALDAALRAIIPVIERELGPSEPVNQAVLEWNRVIKLPLDFAGVQAKRAALLFALWREADIQALFLRESPQLTNDLLDRVLPLVMPVFLANQAQTSDALVVLVSVVASMWDARDLGAVQPEPDTPETAHQAGRP